MIPKKKPALKPYDPAAIEPKWQKKWASKKLYRSEERKTRDEEGKTEPGKYYILDMFPYPSGEGLHVGHPKGYIATDVISRMKRMQGKSILHPMGFDAFGLPAENYALKTKTHPEVAVKKNVKRFKEQLELIGLDYDWSREINTTDPKYYKWTQWIFIQLLKKGLAYESYEPINWCPSCKTGLANEDLEDGRCERCGTPVEKKPMRQWVLKITDYADRLLRDLDVPMPVPLYARTDGIDSVKKDLPMEERQAVICLVKHWTDDAFLCSKYKSNGWKGFIIGGIEKGEDPGVSAIREVQEESGYKNVRFMKTVGKVDSQFYHAVKKVNRWGHFTCVYLELIDGERGEMSQEEKALHDVEWVPRAEVGSFVNREELKYLWDLFIGAKKQDLSKPLLDWPSSIKESQRNWIGRSEGAVVKFKVESAKSKIEQNESLNPQSSIIQPHIEVFTTRIDTIFSGTFVILAPEHPFLEQNKAKISNWKEISAYIEASKNVPEIERTAAGKDWSGVEVKGFTVTNPATGESMPIWIADFVLGHYGTGAVFADAHDSRDFVLAKKYNIPLKVSIAPDKAAIPEVSKLEKCFEGEGILFNSNQFDGLTSAQARPKIIDWLKERGLATIKVNFRLRDWVFSRQRYWGEPIPVIHCLKCGAVPVPEKDLPVKLPKVKSYEPTGTGESPLAAIDTWVNVKCPTCKGKAKRETNTMPQWAGSSWYYLRYMDVKNKKALVAPDKEKYWAPVDLYVGGAEHATRHLIYARFWHKFLYDIGVVSTIEPFIRLQSVGLIMGEDGRKMGKRFGNVVNPDDVIKAYGADTLRIYEMFMGPFDQQISWSTSSMVGARRFIERVWKLREKVNAIASVSGSFSRPRIGFSEAPAGRVEAAGELAVTNSVSRILHKAIKKVTDDIEAIKFNTAISTLMIATNELESVQSISRDQYETLLKLLAPFAPHAAEELWMSLGNKKSIHIAEWPAFDPALANDTELTIAVQINGKIRATITTHPGRDKADLEREAMDMPEVKKWTAGKKVAKAIVVPDRIVNIVVVDK